MNLRTSFPPFVARVRRFIDSRPFASIIISVIVLFGIVAIFEAGVLFGMHQARHSYRWGENYAQNFGGPRGGFVTFMSAPGDMPNGHGAFGQISNVSLPTFIITDPAHPEERIRVASSTVIRDGTKTVDDASLTKGTYVVVLGSPDDTGVIDASLIRIMPAPPVHAAHPGDVMYINTVSK
jgi:hypothetical protein